MIKRRRTVVLPEREYERRPFILNVWETGETFECFDLLPLLPRIAEAVEDGNEWHLRMVKREPK